MNRIFLKLLFVCCLYCQTTANASHHLPLSQSSHFAVDNEKIPPVRIVYFIPSDRTAIPDRAERLGRVMKCVQDFYQKGMEHNGYGPMTFSLEWENANKLKLYEVNGKKKQEEYGRNDAFVVRDEVREALKSQYGIDANKEYLVIFQLLLKIDGDISSPIQKIELVVESAQEGNSGAWGIWVDPLIRRP